MARRPSFVASILTLQVAPILSQQPARQSIFPGACLFSAISLTQVNYRNRLLANSGEEQWQDAKYAGTITTNPLRSFTQALVTLLTALNVPFISWRRRVTTVDAVSWDTGSKPMASFIVVQIARGMRGKHKHVIESKCDACSLRGVCISRLFVA